MPFHQDSMLLKPSVKAVELNTFETNLVATVELIKQARRQICIYSRDLEHEFYGRGEIVEALKQFAFNSHDGCAQIIVQDVLAARIRPHPLLNLAQSAFVFFVPDACRAGRLSISFGVSD